MTPLACEFSCRSTRGLCRHPRRLSPHTRPVKLIRPPKLRDEVRSCMSVFVPWCASSPLGRLVRTRQERRRRRDLELDLPWPLRSLASTLLPSPQRRRFAWDVN